jgi:23S rRNA pseudouridine1911/1915/1917 synthase
MEKMAQINVVINQESGRIDKVLSDLLKEHSRSQIQQWLKEQNITVNGEVIRSNYKVKAQDEIVISIPEPVELSIQAENIPLDIVYEDDDLLVVNKPQGNGRASFRRTYDRHLGQCVVISY